jgi:hypothetical protein
MNPYLVRYLSIFFFLLILSSCKDEAPENSITLIGVTVNSIPLVDGTINVATSANVRLVFSKAINPTKFENAFTLSSPAGIVNNLDFEYTNAASAVIIRATLETNTTYQLSVNSTSIGQDDASLSTALELSFTTVDGGIITEQAPCTSTSLDCYRNLSITNNAGGSGNFSFYSSYPIDLDNARWEKLTSAVIVVHGLGRDADNYFSYMMSSLRSQNYEDETLLIAPFFKASQDAQSGDLYWSSSAWREGQTSDGAANISSFAVIDQVLALLADKNHFPVLEKVIITGHSSGALFTQVYAAANTSENQYTDLDFSYVVANSQYFYYPDDVRYSASSGQFEAVTGCSTFNHWPMGFVNRPAYLASTSEATVDQNIIERKITYLLGTNDVVTTGTLNTTDCEAVLLGQNRFKRGENIFRLMETNYANTNQSEKITVNGVGHDGQAMYQSSEFKAWLNALL